MFRVRIDVSESLSQIESVNRRLTRTEVADGLQLIGIALLSEIKLDFEKKSKGGTGASGIKWKALKESTIIRKNKRAGKKAFRDLSQSQINVDRGLLRSSVTPGFTSAEGGNVLEVDTAGLSVTVGYGMEYAEYVDVKRTLIPEELPVEWIDTIEETLTTWGQNILDAEMD